MARQADVVRRGAAGERRSAKRSSIEGVSDGRLPNDADARGQEMEQAAALEATYHGIELPRAEDVVPRWVACQRCEVLPAPLVGAGMLHIRTPLNHTLGRVLGLVAASSWPHQHEQGTIRIDVAAGELPVVVRALTDVLTSQEQRDVRVLFQPAGRTLAVADYFAVEPLPAFQAQVESTWLVELLRGQRLRSLFQPIVAARPEPRADERPAHVVHGYECLLRGIADDGGDMAPGPMFALARGAGLTFQLDLAARRSAIICAARQHIGVRVFVNFAPQSIYEPRNCLRSTVALIDEIGLRRDQIVFEVVESERFEDFDHLARIADYYRERDFHVALDDVGAGYASLNALVALRPDYAKLDMGLIRSVHRDPTRAVVARKLLETAGELGIASVVEGIETIEECEWAERHGATYLQGYYFARPAATPPAVRL